MNNLISVIIPVYNCEKYLERCLESIISQTYRNLEILIIDDGSVDKSAEIITGYAQKDKRIIAIHQSNQGVSAARNKGLDISTGEFIGFIDADDAAEKDMYEFLYRNLVRYNTDISHCGFELVKPHMSVKFHGTGTVLVQSRHEGVTEILTGRRVEPSACTKLFKKSVLRNVSFPPDIKNNEDLLFNIEAFNNARNSVFEDQIKYRYISNAASASRTSFSVKKAQDVYKVAKRIKEILQENPTRQAAEKFYALRLLTILQELHSHHLFRSDFAKKLRNEVSTIDFTHHEFRTRTLKVLLVKLPFLYSAFRWIYDLFFMKNQKWKDH